MCFTIQWLQNELKLHSFSIALKLIFCIKLFVFKKIFSLNLWQHASYLRGTSGDCDGDFPCTGDIFGEIEKLEVFDEAGGEDVCLHGFKIKSAGKEHFLCGRVGNYV